MPLGLSPYVTSTSVSQDNRSNARTENDRPSPLRISKQPNSTANTRGGNHDQHPVYPAQEFIHPLQKHSANHLNISKRRSLWALSSQLVEPEEPRAVPPRPYSVSPNMALASRFSPMPDEKSEGKDPHPAEEAEEMLREASPSAKCLARGLPQVCRILYAGSKTLILAQIRINPKLIARHVSKAHRRQKSDELMADLESQLGDSQMPYMKVKVTYSHSAFSDYFGHEILVGVAQRCTKLETTAVGALKQHNVGSAWSPPPIYSIESIKAAMQRHWKADVAAIWLQRIKDSERAGIQQSTKQGENPDEELQEANCRDPMHRPAISMEAMCQKMTVNRLSESRRHVQSPYYGNERPELKPPATNMGSVRSRRSWSRNTSGTTCTSGSLRKKKSFAAGIWRTLTPSINIPKNEGDGSAQGPWNWNAWF
ncbi:hypothetical protein ARSEF4850_004488 [Beauveria asiatica]